MTVNLESSQTANELAYEKLVTVIEASKGTLALMIAVCDDSKFRDRIIQRYEQELKPDFETYRLQLARTEPSLRAALGAWAEQQSQPPTSAMLTVTGAEDLLWFNLKDEDRARTEVEKFFGYLQWGRDGLREFPYPIVLWITPRIFKNLSLKAPDFWSWRKGVFRFVSDEVPEPSVLNRNRDVPLSFSESDSFLLPLEDLQELIAATEQREGAEAPLLGTLYGRLAQVYQRRIERGEAKSLQEERNLAIENYQKAIALWDKPGQEIILVNTFNRLGGFYHSQGQFQDSLLMFQNALETAQKIHNLEEEGASTSNLGYAYSSLGDYQQAIHCYLKGLKIFTEIGHSQFQATTLNNLGVVYNNLGFYQQAIDCYQEALSIQRELKDLEGEGGSLCNLGLAYYTLQDYPKALDFYQEALQILRKKSYSKFLAATLGNLGLVYFSMNQLEKAIELYQESLQIQHKIGDREGEATSLKNLGIAYESLDEYQNAIEFYEKSLAINREIGDLDSEANSLNNLGKAYSSLGQYLQAIEFYEQSLIINRKTGDFRGEADVWFNLGNVLTRTDRISDAIDAYRNARQLYADMELDTEVQHCDNALQRLSSMPNIPSIGQ
jgi:tetratricopeptide (TPR) repeat protein